MIHLGLSIAFISSFAVAASGPLAVHPLVVADAEGADAAELTKHFISLAEKVPVARADSKKVARFLEGQPENHCSPERAECFVGLAQASGAARVLYVSVRLYPVVVSGRLVGADGVTLAEAPLKTVEKPKGKLVDLAKRAIAEVLDALPLDDSSELLAPLVPNPEHQPEKVVTPPTGLPPSRTTGLVAGGVGIGALVGGVALQLAAADTARRFDAAAAGGHVADRSRLRELQGQAVQQQVVGGVLLGAGAVALAGGAYLVLVRGPEAAGPAGAPVVLVAHPGGVSLMGSFP
ncbi:MAG: hypothetical protein ACYC8T_00790 [Myxococcaceae bacterium]